MAAGITVFTSALAGDRDILHAAETRAFTAGCLWNRTRNLVRIDAPEGTGFGKIALFAIGAGHRSAALLAARQALVDAIAVRLVGDDENPAVGEGGREGEHTGDEGRTDKDAHGTQGTDCGLVRLTYRYWVKND